MKARGEREGSSARRAGEQLVAARLTLIAVRSDKPDTLPTSLCSEASLSPTQNRTSVWNGWALTEAVVDGKSGTSSVLPISLVVASIVAPVVASSHRRTVTPSHPSYRRTAADCYARHLPTCSAQLAHVACLLKRIYGNERDHANQISSRIQCACLISLAPGPPLLTSGARRSSRPLLTAQSAGVSAAL